MEKPRTIKLGFYYYDEECGNEVETHMTLPIFPIIEREVDAVREAYDKFLAQVGYVIPDDDD